jgi:hypothetical protein
VIKLIHSAGVVMGVCLLASSASADDPQTYKINLPNQSKIGASEFQQGEYKLVVDAPKVQLMNARNGKTIDVNAKIETADAKFAHTAVTTKLVDGVRQITEIRVGGSKTRLIFESN